MPRAVERRDQGAEQGSGHPAYEIGLSRVLIGPGLRLRHLHRRPLPLPPALHLRLLLAAGAPLPAAEAQPSLPQPAARPPTWAGGRSASSSAHPAGARGGARAQPAACRPGRRAAEQLLGRDRRPTARWWCPRPLSGPQMERQDERTPTYDHWWAFPVCAYDHTFAGNERAVFEQVRDDPSIKKIVLTRSRRVDVTGENVVVAPLRSPEGQQLVLRAGQIFVKHAPRINVPFPLSTTSAQLHQPVARHPAEAVRLGGTRDGEERESVRQHHAGSRAVITSSKIDTLAMAAAFHPLTLQDMWPTGLPRNDFILRREELLPPDLRAQEQRLRDEVAGRRLVMFLPTFKSGQASSYYTLLEHRARPAARLVATPWCRHRGARAHGRPCPHLLADAVAAGHHRPLLAALPRPRGPLSRGATRWSPTTPAAWSTSC